MMLGAPVTDPNLIAQLESNNTPKLGAPVTDPALIAQLEGGSAQPVQAQTNPTFVPRIT
jgi:hypothetical protein